MRFPPEEYQNINKEEEQEEGAFHTEYIDDRQLLCMLDDEEIQARDKGGECDLMMICHIYPMKR